jgi:hypothetical protein
VSRVTSPPRVYIYVYIYICIYIYIYSEINIYIYNIYIIGGGGGGEGRGGRGGGSGQQDAALASLSLASLSHASQTPPSCCSLNTRTPTKPHSAPLQLLAMGGRGVETGVETGGDVCRRGLAAAEAALGMRLVRASEALAACGEVEEASKVVELMEHCLAALQAVQALSKTYQHA